MLNYNDYELLKDCHKKLDDFTRNDAARTTLDPLEMSSLMVLLDILKPVMKDLH